MVPLPKRRSIGSKGLSSTYRAAFADRGRRGDPAWYKSFELLRLFVENAGRLLDRDTINQAVWSGAIINDDSITQCGRDIRRTLGDGAQTMVRQCRAVDTYLLPR